MLFQLKSSLRKLFALCFSLALLTACGPLGDLVYQGKTTELGPFQLDGTINLLLGGNILDNTS